MLNASATTESQARRAVAAYGGALELVDLGDAQDGPQTVIADNIFHRAVAFGPRQPRLPADALDVRVLVNGQVRAAASAPDFGPLGRVSLAVRE